MARKRKGGQRTPSFGLAADAEQKRGSGKRIERYEDTLEEGGVDDFMFKRDQIMFNPRDEGSDEDIADVGEEVMAIPTRQRPAPVEAVMEEDEEEEMDPPSRKRRKEKVKPDVSGKGRFGKPIVDSDDEASGSGASGSGSSDEDEEGWGRQYYSVPSSRREKEKEGEYDEKREEERELEEREVRRLQRKAREALNGEDYGLEDEDVEVVQREEEERVEKVALPETSDPAELLRYMEVHEPVKLALAREWPLVVRKLEKTRKGIRKMEAEAEGQLHRGLGWLHYQTLLSYASTLAFYIHLSCLPPSQRPDLSAHPILTRLLELKKGVSDLEDLDFDAASVSGDALVPTGWASDEDEDVDEDEDEAELRELIKAKKEMIARMMRGEVTEGEEEEDEDEWRKEGLEDGELAGLLADAGSDSDDDGLPVKKKLKAKSKKGQDGKAKKAKKSRSDAVPVAPAQVFSTLAEPAFFTSSSKPKARQEINDDLGDPTALLDADAEDKDRRKRSLAFHTSKIASTANRRAAAREKRMGGDEDIPYRDRQAARDAALRKQSRSGAEGEALDGREMTASEKKAAREVRDELGEDIGGDEDGEGYYDLISRSKSSVKAARAAAHQASQDERMESLRELDKEGEGGPRSLTRAIEKNKGLTPRRSKAGRNPRVKKRLAYEKAKQKVGSQRAVYKGGQGAQGGAYGGEKTGISTVVKSRRF